MNWRLEMLIKAIAEGKTMKEIASDWHRSLKTVEWWWAKAKQLFGFRSYVDATRYAIKKGMITL